MGTSAVGSSLICYATMLTLFDIPGGTVVQTREYMVFLKSRKIEDQSSIQILKRKIPDSLFRDLIKF